MFADRLRKIWTKVENLPGEILTCPSCLHSGLTVALVNSFDKMRYPLESKSAYYKCAKCGVMYLEPRPTLQELRSAIRVTIRMMNPFVWRQPNCSASTARLS